MNIYDSTKSNILSGTALSIDSKPNITEIEFDTPIKQAQSSDKLFPDNYFTYDIHRHLQTKITLTLGSLMVLILLSVFSLT